MKRQGTAERKRIGVIMGGPSAEREVSLISGRRTALVLPWEIKNGEAPRVELLADAKALAARQRTTLTRLIEEGLQLRLRARPASSITFERAPSAPTR